MLLQISFSESPPSTDLSFTDIAVLFPFHIPIYVPTVFVHIALSTLCRLRIISIARSRIWARRHGLGPLDASQARTPRLTRLRFPLNFVTAPLIADLFLLAILAIGRDEVYAGTIGSNHINPIDIMVFFLTLAYIAISIDASGLIRYLAFRILKWGGEVGHRLFFYLYAFFFALGSFIGNDPIILSGTAFLAYMTRVSSNIEHPRAWIHTQFAVANIASAILVSSNPTNLVLAGAFNIRFIDYTANMVVPVVITAIVLFPFLLYIIFAHERLIPLKITMHELPEGLRQKKPVNPNIPNAKGAAEEWGDDNVADDQGKLLSLEEIMNPFVDRWGAGFGAVIMAVTLVTVLAINAVSQSIGEQPVFYVTLPAAFIMFCWDVGFGWVHREETREIARKGREELETARAEQLMRREAEQEGLSQTGGGISSSSKGLPDDTSRNDTESRSGESRIDDTKNLEMRTFHQQDGNDAEKHEPLALNQASPGTTEKGPDGNEKDKKQHPQEENNRAGKEACTDVEPALQHKDNARVLTRAQEPKTLESISNNSYRWCQETFPTVTAVLAHLPFALVPFAFSMFVLVEALVTKGWVPVFAYGWDHWVEKTGTIGAIGGMAFLSVILCNVSPTQAFVNHRTGLC